jgi:hypothetical protein
LYKWARPAFRFEPPRDNFWIVGDPEVKARFESPEITSGLALIRLRSGSPPELDDFLAIAF